MKKTNQLLSLADRIEEKYSSTDTIQSLKDCLFDLNKVMESGQLDASNKSLLHWVFKRIDSLLFQLEK